MGLTPFRELPLSDKFMFGEVMRQEAVCKLFLEELLDCKIATLRFSDKEVDISDAAYNHGIRLDVFLADENSTHYDIEMQNTDDALEKRSRYYQSSIDRRILERNKGYDKLPESFIIFICNFDHIGLGLAKYEKISHYKGTDTVYNDGSHVIFLNAKYKSKSGVSSAIAEFLDYVREGNDMAVFQTKLANMAKLVTEKVRRNPEKEVAYMTYSEALREEYRKGHSEDHSEGHSEGLAEGILKGRKEGREEGRSELAYELVKAGLLSVEDAAANLGITTAEVCANVEKFYKN